MTADTTDDIIRDIKAELRAAMNGVAAARIRQSGMPYKLVFGVETPRLQEIAREFEPSHALAMRLWQENIRECRILATMLHPVDEFYPELADLWVEQLDKSDVEVAQQLVFNIIARTDYAAEKAFCWMAAEQPMLQLCGFLTIGNLLRKDVQLSDDAIEEFLDQARSVQQSDWLPLRKAVQNAMTYYEFRPKQ